MNHSTDQNKKDYGRLIEALTPKHAPVTRMKFVMPRHRRNRLARLLHHVGRVAAVLVIGVGIGLLLSRPDTTVAAEKTMELGIEKLRSSKWCRIELQARMLPSTHIRPFRLSPDGEMTPVVMNYYSDSVNAGITLDWVVQGQQHFIRILPEGEVYFDGHKLESSVPADFLRGMSVIFCYDSRKFLEMFDRRMVVDREGNATTVNGWMKDGTVGFVAEFSDYGGRLTCFRISDMSRKPHLMMLETTSIEYFD